MEGGGEQIGEGTGGGAVGAGEKDKAAGRSKFSDGLAARTAGLAGSSIEIVNGDGTDANGWPKTGDGGDDGGLARRRW